MWHPFTTSALLKAPATNSPPLLTLPSSNGSGYTDELVQVRVNNNLDDPMMSQTMLPMDYPMEMYPGDHWVMQDANYNVLGLVDRDGKLVERYEYSPYGERKVFVSAGTNDPGCYAPTLLSRRGVNRIWTLGTPEELLEFETPYGLCEFGHQGLPHEEEIDNGSMIQNRMRIRRGERWYQRDPWQKNRLRPTAGDGYQDGMNHYQVEISNPIINTDMFGEDTDGDCYCGPDITRQLDLLMSQVEVLFDRLSGKQQKDLCGGDYWPPDGYVGPGTWDTTLYLDPTKIKRGKCPSGKMCEVDTNSGPGKNGGASVTINGKCYASYDVNYVLYGRMASLCNDWARAESWFHVYKSRHSKDRYVASSGFMHWGGSWGYRNVYENTSGKSLDYLNRGPNTTPPERLKQCKPCDQIYSDVLHGHVYGKNGVKIEW